MVKGKTKKAAKKERYVGQVNPRLRSMLAASEYRQLIGLLSTLKEQGFLDSFLQKSEEYVTQLNIMQLVSAEQEKGGRGVMQTFKKDWPRIWPAELDGERQYAFQRVEAFWGRLDRSKLLEDVMKDVLPDMQKGYADKLESKDQQKLMKMSDDERRDEIMNRMGKSELVKQFAILSKSDKEVQALGPQMAPFVAKFVSIFERKFATATESMAKTVDYALIGAAAVVVLIILAATGVLKLPDPTW